MPGISRFKQVAAEVKYNVTTDFPHLGLHEAAATGNLGLVNYALSHGQPINSVLHGVLPLHAACSGGDELVVNLLIENGADVNAPRLPLRYTSDKNRDASAPIVGNSGSTPLHFACANGHANIVRILLQHGAHPDRADKHGITPEALARETGHDGCADVIKQWISEKDQDLRNRAKYSYDGFDEEPSPPQERRRSFIIDGTRRHLGVKRSIDNALNLFKSTSSSTPLHLTPPTGVSPTESPSPSPTSGQCDYGFFVCSPPASAEALPARRPSLPHTSAQSRRKSGSSSRRPSSAGNGDETESQQRALGAGKTASKYSLRNLFRKYSGEVPTTSTTDPPHVQSTVSSSPTNRRMPLPSYGSSPRSSSPSRAGSRPMSDGRLDSRPQGFSPKQLQKKLSSENIPFSAEPASDLALSTSSPPNRPGILRGHQRSSSGQRSSSRALRFHSSSTSSSTSFLRRSSSPRRRSSTGLKPSGSPDSPSSPVASAMEREVPESAPPTITTFFDGDSIGEDDTVGSSSPSGQLNRLHELKSQHRDNSSDSFTSSLSRDPEIDSPMTKDFPFSINCPPPTEVKLSPHRESLETRLRGNSVSSTLTDGSADNPQMSSSGTTSGSASVNLITPAMNSSPLPNPRVRVSSLSPELRQDSTEEASPFISKRHHVPIDIDISAISSHAQAEALVQRAQKSILEDDELYSPASATGMGFGRSPLSAKLAAYGETLAIERRLKKEEEDRAAGRARDAQGSRSHKNRSALDRKFSLEEKRSGDRRKSGKSRRPHTADSECETSSGGFPMHPVEPAISKSPLRLHIDLDHSDREPELASGTGSVEIVEISPTPVQSPLNSRSPLAGPPDSGSTIEYPSRAHTPDPPSEMYDSFQTVQGAPLSRVSTAPSQPTFNDLLPRKSQREHSQQTYRTNKLAKMGFSPAEALQSSSGTSRQNTKTKFGGIRSLVYSLKGKGTQ